MKADKVTLVYFSPTGTTKKVLEGIAETIGASEVNSIDLTKPEAVSKEYDIISDGLVIFGAPVYAGRIPVEAEDRLRKIKGVGVPAVVVAVYGNREYDDALIELRELAIEQGFKPIGGAVFVGEHSYSTEETPLAAGRPDAQDIDIARDMGKKLAEKLEKTLKAEDIGELSVPGTLPLPERRPMGKNPPVTNMKLCTMCGICVSSCPTAAITMIDEIVTDAEACILCAACVKNCPPQARKLENERVQKARTWLSESCKERKEPVIFVD